jgi:hypothetical protein
MTTDGRWAPEYLGPDDLDPLDREQFAVLRRAEEAVISTMADNPRLSATIRFAFLAPTTSPCGALAVMLSCFFGLFAVVAGVFAIAAGRWH